MANKSKSKAKLLTKKQLRKRDLSYRTRKSKTRRKSAAAEKRKAIIEHLKSREPLKKFRKRKYSSLSSHSASPSSFSSPNSPKFKRKKLKSKKIDSSLLNPSPRPRTLKKQEFFKSELKKAHAEIIDLRALLAQSNTALIISEKEMELCKKETKSLKKKIKSYINADKQEGNFEF